jgi:hypothetical protein
MTTPSVHHDAPLPLPGLEPSPSSCPAGQARAFASTARDISRSPLWRTTPRSPSSCQPPPAPKVPIEFNSLQFVPRAVLLVFFYIFVFTCRYQLKRKELKLRFKSLNPPGKSVVPRCSMRPDSRFCHTAYFRRPSEKRGAGGAQRRLTPSFPKLFPLPASGMASRGGVMPPSAVSGAWAPDERQGGWVSSLPLPAVKDGMQRETWITLTAASPLSPLPAKGLFLFVPCTQTPRSVPPGG